MRRSSVFGVGAPWPSVRAWGSCLYVSLSRWGRGSAGPNGLVAPVGVAHGGHPPGPRTTSRSSVSRSVLVPPAGQPRPSPRGRGGWPSSGCRQPILGGSRTGSHGTAGDRLGDGHGCFNRSSRLIRRPATSDHRRPMTAPQTMARYGSGARRRRYGGRPRRRVDAVGRCASAGELDASAGRSPDPIGEDGVSEYGTHDAAVAAHRARRGAVSPRVDERLDVGRSD